MSKKTCPSCGAEVPSAASRCKHCFHEFGGGEGIPKKSSGLVLLLATLAAMLCVGAAAMWYVVNHQAVKRNVVIDQETQSVVWTRTSSQGTETDRLAFENIKEIEFVIGGKRATWEVYAVQLDGDKKLLHSSSTDSLDGYADHISHVMEKPLVEVRNIKNFDERYTVEE
jgi:hypothetical protein